MPIATSVLTVGVLSEHGAHERRVALDPDAVAQLVAADRVVLAEAGCGDRAGFRDVDYSQAGVRFVTRDTLIARCDALATLTLPKRDVTDALSARQTIIGLLDPLNNLDVTRDLARRCVTLVAFELLPRTSRGSQSMDAQGSQSRAAGYRAVIVGAEKFGRFVPQVHSGSHSATRAHVLVIGAGAAGLEAIATASRLGAIVTGYDTRACVRSEVESLGARFLPSSVVVDSTSGGHSRTRTPAETAIQERELAEVIHGFDIIITTARDPGRTPAELVSVGSLASLRPGSICIDLAASDAGGNIYGSVDGEVVTTAEGVIVVGGGNLASDLPGSASQLYGQSIIAALGSLAPSGTIRVDPANKDHQSMVVCHNGVVTNAETRIAMDLSFLASFTIPKTQSA